MGSRCPGRRQRLSLLQDVAHRRVLQVSGPYLRSRRLTNTRIRARVASRCIQSTDTVFLMLVTNTWAMTRKVGSPIICRALSLSARAS